MTNSNVPVRLDPPEQGKACYLVWRTRFVIDDKYVLSKAVGKGAYGVVCSAKDSKTGQKVAIKKISRTFDNLVDARRLLREIKLLQHLRHENVISLLDIMELPCKDDYSEVYLVYELMDTDLHQIIRSQQPLSDEHFQYFLYQILKGLKYVHSANVLHRDLKPNNLLLNANCDLKICDFGLARTSSEKNLMTEYVVTRWYRAPELLLSVEQYTAAIDVWSVGCIFAELLQRRPVFPGKDYIDQLKRILQVVGRPTEQELTFISSSKARAYIRALPGQKRNLREIFPTATSAALDLLDKMLQFDPRRRITVEEALQHPYLAALHDVSTEPSCKVTFDFEFEEEQLDEQTLRQMIWEEVQHFHP